MNKQMRMLVLVGKSAYIAFITVEKEGIRCKRSRGEIINGMSVCDEAGDLLTANPILFAQFLVGEEVFLETKTDLKGS